MKPLILLYAIVQLLITEVFQTESSNFEIYHFTMVKDYASGKNNLLTIDYNDALYRINCIDFEGKSKTLFSTPKDKGPIKPNFLEAESFWFFTNRLYRLDLKTLTIDTTVLQNENYVYVRSYVFRDMRYLLCSNNQEIKIFNPENFDEIECIQRENSVNNDEVDVLNGQILYRHDRDKLALYDLDSRKDLWRVKTEEQPGFFMGIKLGTSTDIYTEYQFSKTGEVYATTFSGCLYRIESQTGKILAHKTRFKGEDNNAGLIANFNLIDMNDDQIPDMVGPAVDNNVYCLDGRDLSVIWEFNTGYEAQLPVSHYDINRDSIPEVFGVNDEMKLSIIDGRSGRCLYERIIQEGITKGRNQTEVILGDFNGNGRLNIVTRSATNRLQVLELPDVNINVYDIIWLPDYKGRGE